MEVPNAPNILNFLKNNTIFGKNSENMISAVNSTNFLRVMLKIPIYSCCFACCFTHVVLLMSFCLAFSTKKICKAKIKPLAPESIYVELNHLKKRWLLCYTCNTNVNIIEKHSDVLERSLDTNFLQV